MNKIKIKFIVIIICFFQQVYGFITNEVTKTYQVKEEIGKALDTKLIFDIIPDNRPSDYEYAVLSAHIYGDVKQGDIINIKQAEWQVISTKQGNNNYFGALYKNEQRKQLVLVHRGTQSFGGVIEDIQGVILRLISSQHEEAYYFTQEAVKQSKNSDFHLSTTGHSLGALLAELSVYWCHDKFAYLDINAVTFESPGSRDLIEKRLLPNLRSNRVDLEKLDIVQYLSYPNLINTWGHHIGTVYQIQPMLGDLGWVPGWYTHQTHSILNIIKIFEEDSQNTLKTSVLMEDWPIGSERNKYFDQSIFLEGKYSLKELNNNKEFVLYYKGHYVPAVGLDEKKQLLLRHFNPGIRGFLAEFFQLHKHLLNEEKTTKALVKYWQNNGVPYNIIDLILSYKIDEYRNINIVSVLVGEDIKDWRNNLSSQLAQHSNFISQLLQSLKQENTSKGIVVIEDTASLDNSVLNMKKEANNTYRKYKGTSKAIARAQKEGFNPNKWRSDSSAESDINHLSISDNAKIINLQMNVKEHRNNSHEEYEFTDKASKEENQKAFLLRSNLVIPIETTFLERPEIIKKIEESLEGTEGIQTIALVGIGGCGKTTLARYYASKTDATIIFEINAETKDTLINSFRSLAYTLANTFELKKELNFIQQIPSPEIQEEQLLNFVKYGLKERENWLLIYDNMEGFSKINHLFPHDFKQWGNGKVIITTRSENIGKTSYVKSKNIIHISELNNNEMLTLFVKILHDTNLDQLPKEEREKVINFLKNIPLFPLDVSIAAYSIKNTHITFEQYIHHVNRYSRNYETLQVKLLSEITDYSKTRYGIISAIIDKLSRMNPQFKELFFFICMLDSQNIPYKLLENYKDAIVIEDSIYNLRKNGLLLIESNANFVIENKVISLHRSTQKIGVVFLMNSLDKKTKEYLIKNIIKAINNFYQFCIKSKDVDSMTLLIPHLKTLLKNIHSINIPIKVKNKFEADVSFILGYIHHKSTGNFFLTKKYFEIVLKNDNHYLSPQMLAILLKDLGKTCLIIGSLKEVLEYCERSIELCRMFPNSELILSDNFLIIGAYHRRNNDFKKAYDSLQKAIRAIPEIESNDTKKLRAEIYIQLSNLYFMHYLNKEERAVANEYAIKALESLGSFELFYIKSKPLPSDVSCDIARHRWKYGEALMWIDTSYNDAYHNLREAEYIMTKRCPSHMQLKARIFTLLAEVLLRKGDLIEAEQKITEGIHVLDLALGTSPTWTPIVVRAEIKIKLGKFNEAYEDCLQVLHLGQAEKSNYHDLKYNMAIYHGAFAKYKLKDYHKSIEHFTAFLKGMDDFCKKFLDKKIYKLLKADGVFTILPFNGESELEDIKTYLQHSLIIFTAIYGNKHPFVQDYIAKNI